MRCFKYAIVCSVIAMCFYKCWKRWSIATTDPSKYSNFACIEQLRTVINDRNTNPVARFFYTVKYSAMCYEAGLTASTRKKKSLASTRRRYRARIRE